MSLVALIAGAYTSTYNAVPVNPTTNGFELQQDSQAEVVNESDVYGGSVIDWVYRGGNAFLQFEALAYAAGAVTPFWPWAALGAMGIIGRLASNVAAPMVLTSTAGTPAVASPATLTVTNALLAPNSPARLLYHSKVRKVPVRLQALPYDTGGGVIKWFV